MEQNEKIGLLKKTGVIHLKGDNEFIKIRADEYCHRIFCKNNTWYFDKCTMGERDYMKYLMDPTLDISSAEVFLSGEDMYYDYKKTTNGTEK